MSTEKSFAIGCFNFGVKKTPPFEFKGSEYLEELQKTLLKVNDLTNLTIHSDEDFPKYKESINKKTLNLQKDKGHFPNPLVLEIEFSLHIPYKIQAKIIGDKKKYLRTYTENFNVKIINGYEIPVAIVESINPKKKNDPTSAVQIVREYIRNEFKEIKSEYIRFECLGPSPFHLDCFLKPKKPSKESEWFFETEEILQKGYDEMIIYYNQNEFEDAEEAMQNLKFTIRDELGFYYFSQQARVQRMHSWSALQKKLQKLIEIQQTKGILGTYKKFFLRPKLIGELFTGLATFEGENIFGNNYHQNNYKQTFYVEEEIIFKKFIDKRLDEKDDYPIQQISNLVSFFESRRVKSLELTMAIIASLIGGAIGSLITILLQ